MPMVMVTGQREAVHGRGRNPRQRDLARPVEAVRGTLAGARRRFHICRKTCTKLRLTGSTLACGPSAAPRPVSLKPRSTCSHLAQVDDHRAVDLGKRLGVELVGELADRLADQRLAALPHHQRVLLVGAQEGDLLDRDQAHARCRPRP